MRYSFNGKEDDPESVGTGRGLQDYGFRIYNPSLGKFLSVDPLTDNYPWYTPYQFAGNKPIWAVDLDGLEEWVTTTGDMVYGPYVDQQAADQAAAPSILLTSNETNTTTVVGSKYTGSGNVMIVIVGSDQTEVNKDAMEQEATGWDYIYTTDIGAATKWLDATYGRDGKKISTLAYMHHGAGDYQNPLIEGTEPGGGDVKISSDDAICYTQGNANCNGAYTLAQFGIWSKYLTDDANVVFGACYIGLGDALCAEVSNVIGKDKHLNIYFNTSKTAEPGSYTGQTAVFIRTGESANYYKSIPYTWNKYTKGEDGYKLNEQNLNMILRLHGGVETQKKQ